ncbi:MAG: hypothetical protein LBG79_03860 [Spirochaetaceae bacterium]|jgi:tetratricopeptide (TPR) repeat protein|nr:hypothetical protein [Spirochaetaceae bacterium]GMO30219.1 MAG: hypothetical protein Pg6A_19060 [Termitinemataceae bacterium]
MKFFSGIIFFIIALPLFGDGGLSAELEKARALAARSGIAAREQHDALVRLGRLEHLSGNFEAAADSWMKAAYTEQGKRDDNALLGAAACFLALGDWEKAESNTKLVLITAKENSVMLIKAKYMAAQIEAFRTGETQILGALLESGDYEMFRPGIYWTLFKLTGNDDYKRALLSMYPETPEAQALQGKSGVFEAVSPQWLVLPR